MAFQGYLLKMGNDTFPLQYVKAESYTVSPNMIQDLDSERNANGVLMRNVLTHRPSKIELATNELSNVELAEMMLFIKNHFSVSAERKVNLTYFAPDTNDYQQGMFYMPDIVFPIKTIDVKTNSIKYNSVQLKFIEY